ncbi:MAG: peptide deformylase [Trueperaceae bacterium]|nr:peptide deformylase [Trueperaceae bacterium]
MIHPIRLYGDPVLRRTATEVRTFDAALAELATDMIETMHDANGVGLAAPQIGLSKRLFVALELAPDPDGENPTDTDPPAAAALEGPEPDGEPGGETEDGGRAVLATHVMVNPVLVERRGRQVGPDGCLSIPGPWVEDMVRDAEVRVRYQDVDGVPHERWAEGHFAHVVQHELDHLDGVLYFDRLPSDARRAFLDAHRAELADLQRRAKAFLKERPTVPTVD